MAYLDENGIFMSKTKPQHSNTNQYFLANAMKTTTTTKENNRKTYKILMKNLNKQKRISYAIHTK